MINYGVSYVVVSVECYYHGDGRPHDEDVYIHPISFDSIVQADAVCSRLFKVNGESRTFRTVKVFDTADLDIEEKIYEVVYDTDGYSYHDSFKSAIVEAFWNGDCYICSRSALDC